VWHTEISDSKLRKESEASWKNLPSYCICAESFLFVDISIYFFHFCEEFIKYTQCLRKLKSSHITSKIIGVATCIATVFQTSFHFYCVYVVISCLRIKVALPVSSGALLAAIDPEVKMSPQSPYCYCKFHSKGVLKKKTCMFSKMYYHTRFRGTR
jgi:hypothetical protein